MNNQSIEVDREFMEQTVADLIQSRDLLTRERDGMDARIKALGERIQAIQLKLAQAVGSNGQKARLRKGEGIAAILNVLNGLDGLGMSQVQISEKTNIPGSTVFRLLKGSDKVQVGPDNLWRKK